MWVLTGIDDGYCVYGNSSETENFHFSATNDSKMLMKLTSGLNFINVFCSHYLYESSKNALKTLMKLTPGVNFTNVFLQAFFVRTKQNVTRKKTFIQKTCTKIVGKIDPRFNFINVLQIVFTLADLKSLKRYKICV